MQGREETASVFITLWCEGGATPLRVASPARRPERPHSGEVIFMVTDTAPAQVPTTLIDDEADAAAPTEDLAGVRMTREWAGEAWDEARDAFSKKMRLDAWDRLDTKHHANKGKIKIPYKDTVLMLSGDRGSGKTAIATLMAAPLYEQGMEVFFERVPPVRLPHRPRRHFHLRRVST